MRKKIYILHQTGAPRHFESLFYMNKKNRKYNDVVQVEFNIIRKLGKGLLTFKLGYIKKAVMNLFYLVNFLFTKNKTIIVGIAPYDIFIIYMLILKKKHKLIYYSSWPYWNLTKYPKRIFFKSQVHMWQVFLKDIKVVAVTDKVKKGLSQYTSNITVIPHCINPSIFNGNTANKINSSLRFLFVGRITESKGINIIIDIIENDRNSKYNEWWFVGEGNLSNKIRLICDRRKNCKYFGKISEQNKLAQIYKQCDVLLLPSIPQKNWEELFGIVLIEAMACKVVPISSSGVGPSTIIRNQVDGLLLKSVDSISLKKAIISIVSDPKKLEFMQHNAYQRVMSNYSINITSQLWAKVLQHDI
ncbi:glycosyltransferase family 4 protein [Sporolactobacillus sp. THM19-2]|uniref:glycosyltransferase family 4 protein n=1 Tax=Sporolactobacillus sp. THM19-2 TaxID=2511171 RepID=UPI00101F48B3|nr:glycosyltransferase family 4 protein [Sporolactobacillus sp. THM19-2]RYL93935.1 glycosyltransferase [Sporolactobacillus sp. THM19-2]